MTNFINHIRRLISMAMFSIGGKFFSGKNISIKNNEVFIDGKLVDGESISSGVKNGIMAVHIVEGTVENIVCDGSVTAGNVKNDVTAGGSVTCDCVGRDVAAGGSVRCGRVGRDITAGGSVRHA